MSCFWQTLTKLSMDEEKTSMTDLEVICSIVKYLFTSLVISDY